MKKSNNVRPPKSLKAHIRLSFLIFTLVILVLLWAFQYFFLVRYYATMKTRDLTDVSDSLADSINSKNLQRKTRELAYKNSLCIVITDDMGNAELMENTLGSFSFLLQDMMNNHSRIMFSLKNEYTNSGKKNYIRKYRNDDFDTEELFLIRKVSSERGAKYIYIEASTEPIDATASIIKEQLIYITIILFELAFIITLFISNRISKPLVGLTKTASKFADGDYTISYDHSEYTEIKQLSDVLNKATSEVSKVTDLRRDIIANVSHDLRTPLTMVKAYAEMIRDISGDNPQKRQQHVQVIIDEADRLSNLVNSILELSKLESSDKPLDISDFSLHQKLSEIMQRYQVLSEIDGYTFEVIKSDDRICHADITTIEQVFYNLINNAVNYAGDDKTVIIKQINQDNSVLIEITDHGKGIPSDLLPVIFDRYYRAPKTKRDVIGTGLGLSIVKEILKKHNFAFGVFSEEDKGSTFWFEIACSNDTTPPALTDKSK